MWSETALETVGRYTHNVVEFGINLLPGSSFPEAGAAAGRGEYGAAAIMLSTELLGPIGKEARAINSFEKTAVKEMTVGGGATLAKLSEDEIRRIQNAANRSGAEISVVGSRVNPNQVLHAGSDYDYVINANNKVKSDLKGSLPGAKNVREGQRSNLDIFNVPLDKTLPYVSFHPL